MYSSDFKQAQRSQEVIAQYVSKIRTLLSDGTPKRFTQIMEEVNLTRSPVTQALKAMEFSGEIQTFKAPDKSANHTKPVTWFQLISKQ